MEAQQASGRRLRVTWVKSAIGYRQSQRLTIKSLGLRKLNQSVEHYDSPSIRGMLAKVHHLVRVEELPADAPVEPRGETGTQRFIARQQKKAAAREAFLAAMMAEQGEQGAGTADGAPAVQPDVDSEAGDARADAGVGGPTEAGATPEQEASLREPIGDAVDAAQEPLDLADSGPRSNDAIEAETDETAADARPPGSS